MDNARAPRQLPLPRDAMAPVLIIPRNTPNQPPRVKLTRRATPATMLAFATAAVPHHPVVYDRLPAPLNHLLLTRELRLQQVASQRRIRKCRASAPNVWAVQRSTTDKASGQLLAPAGNTASACRSRLNCYRLVSTTGWQVSRAPRVMRRKGQIEPLPFRTRGSTCVSPVPFFAWSGMRGRGSEATHGATRLTLSDQPETNLS